MWSLFSWSCRLDQCHKTNHMRVWVLSAVSLWNQRQVKQESGGRREHGTWSTTQNKKQDHAFSIPQHLIMFYFVCYFTCSLNLVANWLTTRGNPNSTYARHSQHNNNHQKLSFGGEGFFSLCICPWAQLHTPQARSCEVTRAALTQSCTMQ